METPRSLHKHPLKLVNHLRVGEDDAPPDAKRTCNHCHDELSGRVYACDDCGFYLHQACANLPQSLRHPSHPCILFLKLVPISADGAAEPQHMMIFYRCEACNFELDDVRALWQPAFYEGPFYCPKRHLLKSYDAEANEKPPCHVCRERTSGKCYVCLPCKLYVHEDCVFRPFKIRHFFHSCPLFLRQIEGGNCGACLQKCYDTFAYHCRECNFVMHQRCTQFSPISSDEEGILHWSHHHPLKLADDEADETTPNCGGCEKPISGKSYACLSCKYYLHLSCANLPQEIQHFFHGCPLFLRTAAVNRYCDACQHDISKAFSYCCKKCDFDMHVECTEFLPIGSNEEGILHSCHHHPLKLTSKDEEGDETPPMCRGCEKPISQESYACHSCGFYLHLSCANLPQEIQHFFHRCPLFLRTAVNKFCDACQHDISKAFSYYCKKCNFDMHVECTEFLPIGSNEKGILHSCHHHPLKLTSKDEEGDETPPMCRGCEKPISQESYACHSCRFYLHLSCANLPREIHHFFHGYPLSLEVLYRTQCDACFNKCDTGLGYCCQTCYFSMHVGCTLFHSDDSRIQDLSHHHPLKLFEAAERDYYLECNLCVQLITGKETYAGCDLCEFFIHKSCMGLPKTHKPIRYNPITAKDGRKRIQDESHKGHFLNLFEAEGNNFIDQHQQCHLCGREILNYTSYAACPVGNCEFYIHKSCLGSPREISLPLHPCVLSLGRRKSFKCRVCGTHKEAIPYQCKECLFYMDVDCARSSQELDEGGQGELIPHFSHHHPLQLFKDPERDKTDELLGRKLECIVCVGSASGLTYGCKWCCFYLHKSCLDVLPQSISIGDCSFVLSRLQNHCRRCGNYISGWGFLPEAVRARPWCIPCALREALSLSVSPSTMLTKLHFHPCSLTLGLHPTFTCNACFTHCHSHAYYCDQCDFYVGSKCAQISKKSYHNEKEKGWIHRGCHWHPLQLSQGEDASTTSCKICGILCLEASYFCGNCDFHIHKSCLDTLPIKIDHHYLYCTLVLLTTSFFRCVACRKENNSGLTFRSIDRGFDLCLECVLRPKNTLNNDGSFTSIHHWHQLALVEELEKDGAQCILCREKCSGRTYYCSQCKDYFHKECAELPSEMDHPLHKQHPLTLMSSLQLPESNRNCSLCRGDFLLSNDPHHSGVYCYEDEEHSFQLDKKCATRFPSIQYQSHPHLLTVVENMQGEEYCQVCSAACQNKFVFRCVQVKPEKEICNFILHLTCGPLPCEIKHSCHVHPLILEDFYVEENYTDKFPCHFCEERRDPKLPVYLCGEGCPMMCEITCVISEVMPKLLGLRGEVELRTTFPNVASKVITNTTYAAKDGDSHSTTVLDLILVEMKKPSIERIIKKWQSEMLLSQGIKIERADEDKNLFRFSKDASQDFSSKFECTRLTLEGAGIPKFISQHNGPAVEGEYYILPHTLVPVFRELFGQNGTIAATFEQHPESKSFKSVFVFLLCGVVHNMRVTKLVDVTNERALQWLTLLKLVEHAGFDIDFILDEIKLVWGAHFLIQSKALVDSTSKHLREELNQLSREEEELERKLEETRKKKRATQEQQDIHYEYEKVGMKSLKKELKDVLLIKWKPASNGVIQSRPRQPDATD